MFDDMIADMISHNTRNNVITKAFINGWELNISFPITYDIGFKDCAKLYRTCAAELQSYLVIYTNFHQIMFYTFQRIYWKKYRK